MIADVQPIGARTRRPPALLQRLSTQNRRLVLCLLLLVTDLAAFAVHPAKIPIHRGAVGLLNLDE